MSVRRYSSCNPSGGTGVGRRRSKWEIVVATHGARCFASLIVNRHPGPYAVPRGPGRPSVEILLLPCRRQCSSASVRSERGRLRVSPVANSLGALERGN